VQRYGYDSKIMFSSVRTTEHVRNAINIGVHTITVPLKILKSLTDNHFTTIGTEQFLNDTRLMTVRVKDAINGINPIVNGKTNLKDAIVKMTEYGFGCITVVNDGGDTLGVFTDGDLRRLLQSGGENILDKQVGTLEYKTPISIDVNALLNDAAGIFNKMKVDNILATDNNKPVGMLDIQDLKTF
jgi:signal-transduction protein with cAMP-binding, CBS, and nucleotidyltransferase domain